MKRRELLRNSLATAPLALVPGRLFKAFTRAPASQGHDPEAARGGRDDFYKLLHDARHALEAAEFRHAYELYTKAQGRLAEADPSGPKAEILEQRRWLADILNETEECAAAHRAGIAAKQSDPEAHYWFAFVLSRAGRDEEAHAEYERALALNHGAKDACWLGMGLSRYRQGRYREALPWFERIAWTEHEEVANLLGVSSHRSALEHRLML